AFWSHLATFGPNFAHGAGSVRLDWINLPPFQLFKSLSCWGGDEATVLLDCEDKQLRPGSSAHITSQMSELTKEALLEYVKKQKAKIKKLEVEVTSLKDANGKAASTAAPAGNTEATAALEQERDTLKKHLDERAAELSSLQSRVDLAEREKASEAAQKDAEIQSLTESAAAAQGILQQQLEGFRGQLTEAEAARASLESRGAQEQAAQQAQALLVAELQAQAKTLQQQAEQQGAVVKSLGSALAEREAAVAEAGANAVKLIAAQAAVAVELEAARRQLVESADAAAITSRQKEAEIERLRRSVAEADSAKGGKKGKNKKGKGADDEVDAAAERVAQLERDLSEQQTRQRQLDEELARARQEAAEVGALRGQLSAAERDSQQLSQQVAAAQSDAMQQVEKLQSGLKASQEALVQAEAAAAAVAERSAALSSEVQSLTVAQQASKALGVAKEAELVATAAKAAEGAAALEAGREQVAALQRRIAELDAGAGESASLGEQVAAVRQQLETAASERDAAARDRDASAASLAALTEQHAQAESTSRKLMAKLKQKTKECADLTTAAGGSSGQAAALAALGVRAESVERERDELVSRVKSANAAQTDSDERISTLLREKNKLQEELFQSMHRADSATKEAAAVRDDREKVRQQYLEAHGKLQALSISSRREIDALTAKVPELTAARDASAAQAAALSETLALSNAELTRYKESSSALSQANGKLREKGAATEALRKELLDVRTEAEAKEQASTERLKKLKLLLQKVNAVSQDKDARLTALLSANDRAKRFNIVARIGVPSQDGKILEWCLAFDHGVSAPDAKKGSKRIASEEDLEGTGAGAYRWVEERVAHRWVAEGSSLLGGWPQPLQDLHAQELDAVQRQLERERDDLAARLGETSAQFQAYKLRAQTALKRIGAEERGERQRVQEAENAEIERLRAAVQDLREKEADVAAQLQDRDQALAEGAKAAAELRVRGERLENTVADAEQALQIAERRVEQQQQEIATLQADSSKMQEQYETAESQNRERRLLQLRAEEEAALRAAVAPDNSPKKPASADRGAKGGLGLERATSTDAPFSLEPPSQTEAPPSRPLRRPLSELSMGEGGQEVTPSIDTKLLLFEKVSTPAAPPHTPVASLSLFLYLSLPSLS
ncbi:hypothetical protein B484DRAFT_246788, partial [Ochromonadaceae sp. CCMP2298]